MPDSLPVWLGQVWSDNPESSAITRVFTVLSLHSEPNTATWASPGSERYAYCEPLQSARAGLGDPGLDPFFADLKDFVPEGKWYRLVTYDPGWPAPSEKPIETPIGTFFRKNDHFFWNDNEGRSFVSGPDHPGLHLWKPDDSHPQDGTWVKMSESRSQLKNFNEFMCEAHKLVYGIGDAPDQQPDD